MSKETFTVVAFRYDQHKSVLYHKCEDVSEVAKEVFLALRGYDADVVSIRRVYEKCPIPKEQT